MQRGYPKGEIAQHDGRTMTPDDFPIQTTQILRYGDTDRQGHINNAVYATFFESGRVGVLYDPERSMPPRGHAFVIAQLNIRFVAETHWPGEVLIGTRVVRLGRSSIVMEQAVFCDGTLRASAESTIVLTDLGTRRSAPLTDVVRARFTELMG